MMTKTRQIVTKTEKGMNEITVYCGPHPTVHVIPSFQSSKNRTESGGRHRGEMLGLLNDQRPSGQDGS